MLGIKILRQIVVVVLIRDFINCNKEHAASGL
jgi:hypothetical protein